VDQYGWEPELPKTFRAECVMPSYRHEDILFYFITNACIQKESVITLRGFCYSSPHQTLADSVLRVPTPKVSSNMLSPTVRAVQEHWTCIPTPREHRLLSQL
jgi:hypothetical protein